MRKIASLSLLLQVLVLSLFAADAPKECSLCVGAVADVSAAPSAQVPLLLQVRGSELPTLAAYVDGLTPEQRKRTTLVASYSLDRERDALAQVEEQTKGIVEWARLHGPFDALGISVAEAEPAVAAYAIKRLAVTAQGLDVASKIVLPPMSAEALSKLYEAGAGSYVDALLTDAANVQASVAWIAEHDPSKKVWAVVEATAPNRAYDLARALADGATRAYLDNATAKDIPSLANVNRAFAGDWAYDSTAKSTVLDAKGGSVEMPLVTFVRGEDLRTIVVPRGDAATTTIVSLPTEQYTKPRRVDAGGERDLTDSGRRGGRFLVGMQPATSPFLLSVDFAEKPNANVTKEAIDVATKRGITVEEIIRNHQAYHSYLESVEPRYVARNTTKLRFDIGGGAEAIEATISGDYFSDPGGRTDWVWQDFFINGVKWKYGRIPELPLIQPEKVSQLPLDIHLTNDYRYQLVRESDMGGYHVYEVRFDPPQNAPDSLPLYRGTVWIDSKTFARVRILMVQLNLTGEVLSNEERVDFVPFARETKAPLTPAEVAKTDARALIWLPVTVEAQQVVSAAGRSTPVLRSTTLSDFQLDAPDFEARLQTASASEARMVRETPAGLRYLEKRGNERVVKEGFDSSRLFALGGIHHDSGLQFPVVPLGGIDYFNFNLLNRGIQTNVFFAGIIVAANATHPNVANTRTNLGVDFFGIAIPTESSIYRNGEEQDGEKVKVLPTSLFLRGGHPVFGFGKVDASLGMSHFTYQRAEDTATGFEVPSDTFVITPGIEFRYARRGWNFSSWYDYNRRTTWEPWGNLSEYSNEQQSFSHYGASLGKSFYLPKFQRIGVDLNYIGGKNLDRFSKYELGFFGSQRVHGIRSGSVRAEKALLAHFSYGFVFSQQFRIEAFYDHAMIDDPTAGYRREPFQGLGIAGQTVGPYGTLLRLDVGKTIGRNAQDGFVANVVFLKLF